MRVSPTHLKILASALDVEGFDARLIAQRCAIDSIDALEQAGTWVALDVFDQAMAAAIEASGDASFGLVVGKSIAMMQFRLFTPLALSAPSLRQVLADLLYFSPLALERCEIELVETPGAARLEIEPLVQHGHSGRFRTEQVVSSTMQMLRLAGAEPRDILQIQFPYACPDGLQGRYAAAFGRHLSFGQAACTIEFNPALLDAPQPSHDPLAYTAARTRAELALAAKGHGSDLAEQVRQHVLQAFPHQASVQETAAHLGISERRLRRQLQMLGLSHSDLVQQCQRLAAERLLADAALPLKQVADALGFSSVSTFHRAFRRWAGVTPSAWREGRMA
ncbi:MAG: helix-turn-helix domain-containing protein [Pseudomonadota bacterium]